MGYLATITGPFIDNRQDGKRLLSWLIIEDDSDGVAANGIETDSRYEIPGVPTPSKITLFESDLVTPGLATTLRPRITTVDGGVVDKFGHVSQASGPASYHRIQTDRRIPGEGADGRTDTVSLFVYPTPDADTGPTGVVNTRITVEVGQ